MKKNLLLLLCLFLLKSNKSNAQAALGISQYAYTVYNDTVPAYSFDSVKIFVVNKGASTFNDNFQIITSVGDSTLANLHRVDTAYSFFAPVLPPGDSVAYTLYPYYFIGDSTYQYHYDINVIVIWPIALTAGTSDSLQFNIVILLNADVQEIDLTQYIKAYPNPTTGSFKLENSPEKAIEEVRIYDSSGRLIQVEKTPSSICTDEWKKGTYLVKIQLDNNQTKTIRVIKQ